MVTILLLKKKKNNQRKQNTTTNHHDHSDSSKEKHSVGAFLTVLEIKSMIITAGSMAEGMADIVWKK